MYVIMQYNKLLLILRGIKMIEIKLNISDIDYDSMAELIAPMLREKADKGEVPAWIKLLMIGGGNGIDAVKKVMHRIPDDKKEMFIAGLIDSNSENAGKFLEELAAMKGMRLKVSKVKATHEKGRY